MVKCHLICTDGTPRVKNGAMTSHPETCRPQKSSSLPELLFLPFEEAARLSDRYVTAPNMISTL